MPTPLPNLAKAIRAAVAEVRHGLAFVDSDELAHGLSIGLDSALAVAEELERMPVPPAEGTDGAKDYRAMCAWIVEHSISIETFNGCCVVDWTPDGDAQRVTRGDDWEDAITKAMAEERALRVAEAASEVRG